MDMVDAPELTSMTRRRTVRPLVAAWVFVFVILTAGFIWLSLSPDDLPPNDDPGVADHHKETAAIVQDIAITSPVPQDDNGQSDGPSATMNEGSAPEAIGLAQAPIGGLTMAGANGPLPVLGPDGMVAWKEYARPVANTDDRPKVAIIVTGVGLNARATEMAIKQLPGQVDFGFSPYGQRLQHWMDMSRSHGHEGFLMIPTEPLNYPENDPGPHTLLAGASARDNLKKLDWLLSRLTGYVGVINEMGSKFTASEEDVLPILEELNGRGLMLLDSRSTRFSVGAKLARRISMPRAFNNLFIDNSLSAEDISQKLTTLENTARTYGTAVGVARAFPLTIGEIEKWARGLESRGIELVPITAIANRQPIR